ncbi:MAG TPA: ABC transporter ATP-binding protein [Thermodesulfobacteriota bacterium]|nr:ABC transporter ATP-binding protein [Thermodesulfobacteriota bacterium]
MKDCKIQQAVSDPSALTPLLFEVGSLSKHFGGIQALKGVNLALGENGIVALIGPNGAGKSTFINVTAGIYSPDFGTVKLHGKNIAGWPAHEITRQGIARTFQLQELFMNMTVLENAMAGCFVNGKAGLFASGLKWPSSRAEENHIREEAYENLKVVGLEKKVAASVPALPLGERKMLGIARALGTRPRLMMLDEPAGGLAAHEVARLADLILTFKEKGLSVLVVEHNMPFVMSISEWVIVLDYGIKISEGPPDFVKNDPSVIKAYLGEED